MNPRTPTGQDLKLTFIPSFVGFQKKFTRYLKNKNLSNGYIEDLVNNLNKYRPRGKITSPENLLGFLDENGSRHLKIAIRNFLNFLVDMDYMKEETAFRFKKVINGKRSNPDLFVPTDETVANALGKLTESRYRTMFKILAFSGIRTTELVKFLTEYDESRLIVNEKIIKYPLNYVRGQKKSYFVYLPAEMKSELHRFYMNRKTIEHLHKSGLKPKYLRKWFYNFLIYNNVPESVADFIEGRATQTVGSLHYLSRVKQADYWYDKVVADLIACFGDN